MIARKLILTGLAFASVLLAGFTMPNVAMAAEYGTLKNTTTINIVYQAGYADERGFVSWSTFSLAPGESHTWTVQNPKQKPLQLCWDLTLDDGKFVPTRSGLKTNPNGFTSGFFLTGKQVWINTSGSVR